MRFVIAALLAVVLIQLAPSPERHINKTVVQEKAQAAVKPAEVSASPALTEQAPVQPQPEKQAEQPVAAAPAPTPQPPAPTVLTDKQQLMQAAGIPERDWNAVDYIVSKESSWRHTIWNKSGSGAYGLCQALPASKMANAGADYMTNPVTQLKWCHEYAHGRYGGWWHSFAFWQANRWW